ncbi:MAG: metal ABC transporter ATP-binding protein [Bacteriovoracales bacterium]|nr:metal ABC transporter ATP-binding protein [Bacteriovoracales bacterium]
MEHLLELKDISFHYQKNEPVLDGVKLALRPKQFLGILGPNGGGKSTLLKIIVGLLKPAKGDIYFYNKKIKHFKDFPRHKLSYVPQGDVLESPLPLRIVDIVNFGQPLVKNPNHPPMSADEALHIVGLKKHKEAPIHSISGGERQRTLLAKALMGRPELMVLDEPTKGLDAKGQEQLFDLIETIREENQTAIILVDHHITQVINRSDELLCIDKGSHWVV